MVYSSVSFLLIIYAQFDNIIVAITGEASADTLRQQISEAFDNLFSQFLEILDASDLSASFLIALLWGLIGVISYFIVLKVQRFIIEAEDDLKMETQYVHPRNYNHGIFWFSFFARVIYRVALIVILGLYILFTIEVLLPLWLQLIEGWFAEIASLSRFANAFLGYVGLVATIHFLVVIARAVYIKKEE
jgi:hypothetical protein